jgi:hypothetical protein
MEAYMERDSTDVEDAQFLAGAAAMLLAALLSLILIFAAGDQNALTQCYTDGECEDITVSFAGLL